MKYVPINKRSKKEQRKYYSSQRSGWNGIDPVTRVVKSKKLYDRKKPLPEYDTW